MKDVHLFSAPLLNLLADHALVGIYIVQNNLIVYANQRLAEMFGYLHPEEMAQLPLMCLFAEEHHPRVQHHIEARLAGHQKTARYEVNGQRKKGEIFPLEVYGTVCEYEGQPAIIGNLLDLTEQKQAESALKLMAKVFETSNDAIIISDASNTILKVNQAFSMITGYEEYEIKGKKPGQLSSGLHYKAFYEKMWSALKTEGQWRGEIWDRRKNGELYPKMLSIHVVYDEQGELAHYIGIFSDISSQKEQEAKLQYLAQHDHLTGLPNAELFNERVSQMLHSAAHYSGSVAVCFIDLNRFRQINDLFGYRTGDRFIREMANRLKSTLPEGAVASRYTGDKFTVVLPDAEGTLAGHFAERLRVTLAKALELPDHTTLQVNAHLGISLYPADGTEVDTLIKHAAQACDQITAEDHQGYQFFTSSVNARIVERISLEHQMRQSLEKRDGQFQLFYQPKIDLATGQIMGVEALARWKHPEHGMISPAKFIPIAEETGLIVQLGEWVLYEACRQSAEWRNTLNLPDFVIAVNVSTIQFKREDFIMNLSRILAEQGVPPSALELEVTESILLGEDENKIIEKLEWLRYLGFQLALDDFGTGYSSLSYLRRFPISILKIDQSFVRKMLADPPTRMIVESIIDLARKLGLKLVAEGIEEYEEAMLLKNHFCDIGQGYFFARPMPASELTAHLHRQEVYFPIKGCSFETLDCST